MINIVYSTDSRSKPFDNNSSPHRRRCIDGSVTGYGKCVGYCDFDGHPGYLTKELRKDHQCLAKECRYYLQKAKPLENTSPFAVLAVLL